MPSPSCFPNKPSCPPGWDLCSLGAANVLEQFFQQLGEHKGKFWQSEWPSRYQLTG